MKIWNTGKLTRAFAVPATIALFALASCVADTGSTSEDDLPITGYSTSARFPTLVRYPPGPECPPGMFMGGILPHLTCISEEFYNELEANNK